MTTWPCSDCMKPLRPGPRGGIPVRCAECEAERKAERAARTPRNYYAEHRDAILAHARAKRAQTPAKACRRCGAPARSSRAWYCALCKVQVDATQRRSTAERFNPKSRQERGYDATHDRRRKAWEPKVATGTVPCGRCGMVIVGPWDLGHPGDDKSQTPVPWHRRCNRQYAATVTRRRRSAERGS
jgi:hypothetical protein